MKRIIGLTLSFLRSPQKPKGDSSQFSLEFFTKEDYSNSRVSEETQEYEIGARRGGSEKAFKPVHDKAKKFRIQQKVQERGFR